MASFVNASCSIGASPLEMSASAKPGQIVEINWNIFNLEGDRATHVLISKSSGPNWGISYTPAPSNKTYDVSGVIQSIMENFAIDKSAIVKSKPSGLYVVHPNASEGFIVIDKPMKILISLPSDAKIGETQDFVFTALGSCFGDSGAVTASVATELKVHITPSLGYYEKPVEDDTNQTSFLSGLFSSKMQNPALIVAIGSTLVLIIVLILLFVFLIRKKNKHNEKHEHHHAHGG